MTWPDHLLTLDEWSALPEDARFRLEVVEGALIVTPRSASFHQRAVTRLGYLVNEQLPSELCALSEVDVLIAEHPLTVRAPDVIVTRSELTNANPTRYRPANVRLAVEVLSVGSVRTDRVTKFCEDAEAGIAHYWIVDLDAPARLTRFDLVEDSFELVGEHTGPAIVDLDGTPLTLDLDALTTSRA